jgi:hypothetical protein
MTKKLNRILFVAGLLLSQAVEGQQTTQPLPQATGNQVQPDRLKDDLGFQRLSPEQQDWYMVLTDRHDEAYLRGDTKAIEQVQRELIRELTQHQLVGAIFCGDQAFTEATFLDGAASNADRGETAYVARWLDRTPGSALVHSAVFTATRCISRDFETVDGKIIVQIVGDSLTVGKSPAIAFEAEYFNHPDEASGGGRRHRGVFVNRRFAFELDQSKFHWNLGGRADTDADFTLTSDGQIIPRPGLMLLPPGSPVPAVPSAAKPFAPEQPAKQPPPGAAPKSTPQKPPQPAAKATPAKPALPSNVCVPLPFRPCTPTKR